MSVCSDIPGTKNRPALGCRQEGMLYEWPILAFLLSIVGVVLASYHPGFLILVGLGIVVFFVPWILGLIRSIGDARRVKKSIQALCLAGFSQDLLLHGNRGDKTFVFDATRKKMAVIDSYGKVEQHGLETLQEVVLKADIVTRLGGTPSWTWYFMEFKCAEIHDTLIYTSRRRARNALKRVRQLVGADVPVHDRT
ncbi:MAG: hypothetical protein AB1427_00375 [Thermodesulfobacteriota bacterium]